jgi:hypothetical protein
VAKVPLQSRRFGVSVRRQPIHPHRAGDVLERLLAHVFNRHSADDVPIWTASNLTPKD